MKSPEEIIKEIKENKLSAHIDSWYIKSHESGIYSLIFNTKEKWATYHRYNDTHYSFNCDNIDNANDDDQLIPEFLPKEISYVTTSNQNKDQIVFYFIPIREMLFPKDSEILFSSK